MNSFSKKIFILFTIHIACMLLVFGYSYADDQPSDTAAHAVAETIDQKAEQKRLAAQEREQKKQEKALAKQKAREEKAAKKAEEKRLKEEKEKQEQQAKADAEASRQKALQEEAQQKAETERIAREKQEKQKQEQKRLAAQEREQKKQEEARAKQKAREEKAAKKTEEKRLKEEQEKQAHAEKEAARQKALQEEADHNAARQKMLQQHTMQEHETERIAPQEQINNEPLNVVPHTEETNEKQEQQKREQEAKALKKQIEDQAKQEKARAKQKASEEKAVKKAEAQRLKLEQEIQKKQKEQEETALKNARKETQQKLIQEERVRKAQEALQKQEQKRLQEEEKIKQELNTIDETASEERLWRFAVLDMYATGLVYPDVIQYASEMMRKYIERINNGILIPQKHIEVLSQQKGIMLPSDEHNQNDAMIQSFGNTLGVNIVVVGYIKKIPRKNEYVCTIKEIRTDTGKRMGIEERTFPSIEREIEYAIRGMIENFYNDNKALLKQPAPLCTPIVTSTSLVPSSAMDTSTVAHDTMPFSVGVSTEDMPISTTIAVDTTTVSMSQPVAIDTPTVSYAYDYAIIPFVPLEGMSHNDMRVVTEEVEQHLAARYMVTISETQLAQDNNLSDDAARAIGTTLNAHYVVCGNCAKVMEQYLVTVRAIDVATGATVFNDHTTLEHINTIVDIARIINERWDKNIQ